MEIDKNRFIETVNGDEAFNFYSFSCETVNNATYIMGADDLKKVIDELQIYENYLQEQKRRRLKENG